MAARTRGMRDVTVPRRPGTRGNVVSALAVAAGYGLAISGFTVMMIERVFGPRSQNGRLAVLAITVGALVFVAAAARAKRSLQRRRLGGS